MPDEIAARPLDELSTSRLATDHPHRTEILDEHRRALEANEPGYTDPDTGFFVFTAASLVAQGSCCESGCRHCPYVE